MWHGVRIPRTHRRSEEEVNLIGDGGHAAVVRECQFIGGKWFVSIGDNAARKRVVNEHENLHFTDEIPWASYVVHKTAVISPSATIEEGTVIMAGAIIQAGAVIGRHCIINTGATVDHHCVLEDYVHIAPGAHLCGNVKVGEGALVGVGVGIEPGVVIPPWSTVKRIPYEISLRGNEAA